MECGNVLCDLGQVSSPLWASLFSYSLPRLHCHHGCLETFREERLGMYFEHHTVPFDPTPGDSSSSCSLQFSLHMLFPLPGHPSPPIPDGQLIILEVQLRGHVLLEALLPRQNCGYALHSPLCPHESQTGTLLAGHAVCRPPRAGGLGRARTCSRALGAPAPGTGLALGRVQETPDTPDPSPFLPGSGSQCPAG